MNRMMRRPGSQPTRPPVGRPVSTISNVGQPGLPAPSSADSMQSKNDAAAEPAGRQRAQQQMGVSQHVQRPPAQQRPADEPRHQSAVDRRSATASSLSGFFDEEQLAQPAMPSMPTPVFDDSLPQSQMPRMPRQDASMRMPANSPQPTRRRQGRPQSPSDYRGASQSPVSAAQTVSGTPGAMASSPQQFDPQYEEFLAWKRAQAQRQQMAHPAYQPGPSQGPASSTMPNAAAPAIDDRRGYSPADSLRRSSTDGNAMRQMTPARTQTASMSPQSSPDGEFTPFHYPGYDGTGYPKGLGHGPIVTRKNIKTGKIIRVEGMAWEDFPPSWQEMLDEQPYDDAGALRVFMKATAGIQTKYPYYEIGSAAHASKFLDEMRSKRSLLHNGSDLSYASRPQLDAASWR